MHQPKILGDTMLIETMQSTSARRISAYLISRKMRTFYIEHIEDEWIFHVPSYFDHVRMREKLTGVQFDVELLEP